MTREQKNKVYQCLDTAIGEIRKWQLGMLAVLALFLAVNIALAIRMFWTSDSSYALEATIGTSLLGACSLCLLNLARILKCNSGFLVIKCAIILDNPRFLDILKEQLSCFGKFEEVLNDVRRITGQLGRTAGAGDAQRSD